MSFIIRMPKLSPTMEVGTIAKWHIKEGQAIKAGQVLMEVATDKATVEHQALDAGIVRKLLVSEGHDAQINQPIAIFSAKETDDISSLLQEVERELTPAPAASSVSIAPAQSSASTTLQSANLSQTVSASFQQPQFRAAGVLEDYNIDEDIAPVSEHVKASPYAKKIAAERGIDLTAVKGTGPAGRITAQDLEGVASASNWGFGFDSCQRPRIKPGSYELEAMTPMRKAIATRLQESKTFIPHFYLTQDIDAQALSDLHGQLKSQGLKVSLNDLIVRACAIALRKHPKINSGFDSVEQKIIRFKTIDIAIAVALEQGLITPIIFHADYKSVGQISGQIRQLVAKANNGKLESHEYRGGSFTISNLGMFGIDQFQAIINPPQAAILAVGGAIAKPVVRNGKIEPGLVMSLTLSCDHRVIDGADAAKFLVSLKQLLEAPAILLV